MEERHVPLSTVAGRLGVSERTVRRWIKAGKLRAYRPGRDYRIPESALREFVEESEISPKGAAPSPEPSLLNGLEEERRADWDTAVRSARLLQEHGRTRTEELLALWQESKERGEDPAERRAYLDEIGGLLQRAYDAEMALLTNLEAGLSAGDREAANLLAGGAKEVPNPGWTEVQAADRFYADLFGLVQSAGLSILIDGAQQEKAAQAGQPAGHTVEEAA
jgi:excisionase family DNA binding protein